MNCVGVCTSHSANIVWQPITPLKESYNPLVENHCFKPVVFKFLAT